MAGLFVFWNIVVVNDDVAVVPVVTVVVGWHSLTPQTLCEWECRIYSGSRRVVMECVAQDLWLYDQPVLERHVLLMV